MTAAGDTPPIKILCLTLALRSEVALVIAGSVVFMSISNSANSSRTVVIYQLESQQNVRKCKARFHWRVMNATGQI